MAWVEGLTNSQRILYTIANIFTTSNKVLEKRWRKVEGGVAKDHILTNTGSNVWKDEELTTVTITDYTEVWVASDKPDPKKNWELVYATGGSIDMAKVEVNLSNSALWETVNGFDAKRIILKTTTTPVKVDASYDEYNTDPDSKVDSIDMFVEIVKYRYAINPEENLEVTEHPVTGAALKMENNHYLEIRYCDKIKIERTYVIDVATQTEQPQLTVVNGVICTSKEDPQVPGTYIYTPLSEVDAKLYKIINVYGKTLVEKEDGGHPSEYAKFAWYIDYKEQLVDELDGGPSSDDVSKGIRLMPQIISGMSETIPIQFWINCDNDRVSMVLMGDPTIDYEKYLTSFCYMGKIDSFDGDGVVNDTAGNFALTVGSSTVPSKKPKPLAEAMREDVSIVSFTSSTKNVLEIASRDSKGNITRDITSQFDSVKYSTSGLYLNKTNAEDINDAATINAAVQQYVDKYRVGYKFVAYSKDDETMPSADYDIVYAKLLVDATLVGIKGKTNYNSTYGTYSVATKGTAATKIDVSDATYTFVLKLPKNSKGLKVYKIDGKNKTGFPTNAIMPADYAYGALEPMYLEDTIDLTAASSLIDKGTYFEYTYTVTSDKLMKAVDTSTGTMPLTKSTGAERSVERDGVLHFVLNVIFPSTWGDQTTATGVGDISMFKTRSGVFNQRHYTSFITPEEYMRKDAFNPSRWTGKFHLSPTYIVHGYDGYRGWLKDTVIVDNTSIVHLDELIVNKDSKDENKPQEIYKYFKLNAPFSFLNNSPNFNYGIGILKSKMYIDSKGNKITLF